MGFQVSTATPCLLLSVLDAKKTAAWPAPSSERPPLGVLLVRREHWDLTMMGKRTNGTGPQLG